METSSLNLINILNRAVLEPSNKKYNYNQMFSINSKSALQAGGEELFEYSLNLILHYSLCNPQKSIDIINEFAQNREPFEWIYNGKYMGDFVVNEVEQNLIQTVNGDIWHAELRINLLESPLDNEYKEQKQTEVDLSQYEQFSENSNKIQEIKEKMKLKVKESIKQAITSQTLSGDLSDRAKEILSGATSSILSDISGGNVSDIYSKISSIKNNIQNTQSLDYDDLISIKQSLDRIPESMIATVLRSGK